MKVITEWEMLYCVNRAHGFTPDGAAWLANIHLNEDKAPPEDERELTLRMAEYLRQFQAQDYQI